MPAECAAQCHGCSAGPQPGSETASNRGRQRCGFSKLQNAEDCEHRQQPGCQRTPASFTIAREPGSPVFTTILHETTSCRSSAWERAASPSGMEVNDSPEAGRSNEGQRLGNGKVSYRKLRAGVIRDFRRSDTRPDVAREVATSGRWTMLAPPQTRLPPSCPASGQAVASTAPSRVASTSS